MFSLPVIIIVNAVLFVTLLEERFKTVTTLSITLAATLLGFLSCSVLGGVFSDAATAASVSNAVSVFWLLIAAVFISQNNIAQKLFVALMLITNYAFFTDFGTVLLSRLPIGIAGITGILLGNGLYIILSLLMMALVRRPLHYFYRRGISLFEIGLCLMQFIAWYIASGGANSFFGTDSFALRFFLTLFFYIFIVFTCRSVLGAAKFKAKDIYQSAENELLSIRAENFNSMVVNIESYKNTKGNVLYAFDRIGTLAQNGRTDDIINYVTQAMSQNSDYPLLGNYSENPYVNAVVATRAADASDKGVAIDSNISIGECKITTIELCILIDDVLTWAIKDSEKSTSDDKFVRLNVLPAKDQLTIETVHSTGKADKPDSFTARTFSSYLNGFFDEKNDEDDGLRSVKEIVEKHSGRINISEADSTTIARIGINY